MGLGACVAQYVLDSAVWLSFAFVNPGQVAGAADWSYLPPYRWFFHKVVGAAPAAWAVMAATGELGLAGAIAARRTRALGLGLATAYQVVLAGPTGPAGIANVGIAVGQLALVRHLEHQSARHRSRHLAARAEA